MASSTRQRLVETAYELFSRNGFHAIGLDRIIDEVGVSKQTFYNHFESKDDLILAVLEHRSKDEVNIVTRLLDQFGGDDPRARLLAIFDVLDSMLNDPEFRGCLFITAAAEFPSHTDPAHQAAARHARALLDLYLSLAVRAGVEKPLVVAQQLAILFDGALLLKHVTGNADAPRLAREAGMLLLEQHLPRAEAAIA